jgi:cytochrome o ubiquinol oxidase subunit 3
VLFASLFATFVVFRGMQGSIAFDPVSILIETFALLTSSASCGMALLFARRESVRGALWALGATVALGAVFVGMEFAEFARLLQSGSGPTESGFLSAYFTLVGTHGLHVLAGLIWMGALGIAVLRRGFTAGNLRKFTLLALFWHFLDIVWIFIFTVVYLMGML